MTNQYLATHANDCNGTLCTDAEWAEFTKPYSDRMQAMIALILGVDPKALQAVGLRGGNANFLIAENIGNTFISDDSTCETGLFGTRCSDVTLHFTQTQDGSGNSVWDVHMDSADVYSLPFGPLLHGLIDLIGGNTIFQEGVPH